MFSKVARQDARDKTVPVLFYKRSRDDTKLRIRHLGSLLWKSSLVAPVACAPHLPPVLWASMDSWEAEDEDDGDGHLAASFPKKNPRVIKEDDGDDESDMESEDQELELELATRGAAKRARAGSSASADAGAEAGKAAIMKQVEADAALAASLADQPPPPKKKRSSGKRKPAVVRRAEEEAAAAALAANGDVPPEEPPHDLCVKCQESHSYPGNELLLCDGDDCDSAYHLHCLRPKLLAVPKGDWCVPRPSAPHVGSRRRSRTAERHLA